MNAVVLTLQGDPNIKPEQADTVEAGYQGIFFDNKLSLNTDVFYSNVKDSIDIYNPPTWPEMLVMQFAPSKAQT